jgi:hypothetical protein
MAYYRPKQFVAQMFYRTGSDSGGRRTSQPHLPICNHVLHSAGLAYGSRARGAPSDIRRADMVTGGDVLVETNATLEKFKARLNGQDIARSFRPSKTGALIARVEGLKIGKNTLEVKSANGRAKLELSNYPIGGPSFRERIKTHSCARPNRQAWARRSITIAPPRLL